MLALNSKYFNQPHTVRGQGKEAQKPEVADKFLQSTWPLPEPLLILNKFNQQTDSFHSTG